MIFGAFLLLVSTNFLHLGAFLIKQLFHSRLLDMRLVIANSALGPRWLFTTSKVVYKASWWDYQDFYIGKTKRRLHDRKTEHFKGITSSCHASAIADHVTSTRHTFEILAKGRSDTHCKIKETLLIQELKPTLNDTVSSEKLYLY